MKTKRKPVEEECIRCTNPLLETGALLLSPPGPIVDTMYSVKRYPLCHACYEFIWQEIYYSRQEHVIKCTGCGKKVTLSFYCTFHKKKNLCGDCAEAHTSCKHVEKKRKKSKS